MEPTNHPFGKENDLPNLHHYVPLIFRGVLGVRHHDHMYIHIYHFNRAIITYVFDVDAYTYNLDMKKGL